MLALLERPEFHGSLHFQSLLTYPDSYGVRPQLVKDFIRILFERLWDQGSLTAGARVELEVLEGERGEEGFIEVKSTGQCLQADLSPNVRPVHARFFVVHTGAVTIKRAELSYFFAYFFSHRSKPIVAESFYQQLNKFGALFLEVTGNFAAKNLKFYAISFA